MASRKDELNKAKEAGKSIVEKQNAEKQAASNVEGKDKPKEESLVAKQFGAKKEKTWNDVKSEYNNDPAKIADYLNNATDYTPGNLTKKGMEGFGYTQGDDGKWALKPKAETDTTNSTTDTTNSTTDTTNSTTDTTNSTTDTTTNDYTSDIEKLKKENEEFRKQLEELRNPKTGKTDEEGAKSVSDEHMKRGLEIGALTLDKDGNYVLTNVNKKGWEDWATIASAGLSVLGLAMGVPIIPINFRKITNKDKKDEAIREFQKQLTDISAGNLAKVKDVESSKEAGDYIKENQNSIDAFTNYAEKTAAYKTKSDIDTDSEKELIETRTDAQIKADEKQFERDMKRIESDRDFQIKFAALQQQYAKEMAQLQSDLSTGSAIDLMKYQNSGFLKDLKDMGITPKELASYTASKNGISPADKNWNRVNIVGNILGNFVKALSPGGD